MTMYGKLSDRDGWQHFEQLFILDENNSSIDLYLYTQSGQEKSANLFDNIIIEEHPQLNTYLVKNKAATSTPTLSIKSFERVNPTLLRAFAVRGEGLLVFNESYQEGWVSYIAKRNAPTPTFIDILFDRNLGKEISHHDHVMVNGFANGWLIDKDTNSGQSEFDVILVYQPQRWFYLGLIISGITLIGSIGYLFIARYRRYKKRKSSRIWVVVDA